MRQLSFVTIVGLFCLVWVAHAIAQPKSSKETALPNVVVFLVDDLGYMDIGANNPNCFYETPNIDRFATTGMRFTDAVSYTHLTLPTTPYV